MGVYFYILIFLIGLCFGSFFNVIIFRFNTNLSAVKGRSRCANCRSIIKWFDLVPIFSYFFLKGRCRKCGKKISLMYPVIELFTATILLLFFLNLNTQEPLFLIALNTPIILLLALVAFLDLRYLIIPDKLLALLTIAVISLKFLENSTKFSSLLISALGLTFFFVILFLVSRGKWIGLGDIKLVFLISFLFGYPLSFLAIVLSIWAAAVFSIILMIIGRANLKTEIPFGFFLSITTIVFIIFNHELQEIPKYFF